MDKAKFPEVYAAAKAAGAAAAAASNPVPMVVGEAKGFLGNELDLSKPVYVVEGGPCGFAWVNVKPGNCAFAKWLVKEGLARPDSYEGGVCIWISGYGQSMARKEDHAYAMAAALRAAGIERAYAGSRMD